MDAHDEAASRSQSEEKSTLMTIEEVAEYLRFHPSTVYRLVRQRALPAVKVGKQWRISRELLEEWLRANTIGESKNPGADVRRASFEPGPNPN